MVTSYICHCLHVSHNHVIIAVITDEMIYLVWFEDVSNTTVFVYNKATQEARGIRLQYQNNIVLVLLQDHRHHQQLDFLSQTTWTFQKMLKVRGYTIFACTNNTDLNAFLPFCLCSMIQQLFYVSRLDAYC